MPNSDPKVGCTGSACYTSLLGKSRNWDHWLAWNCLSQERSSWTSLMSCQSLAWPQKSAFDFGGWTWRSCRCLGNAVLHARQFGKLPKKKACISLTSWKSNFYTVFPLVYHFPNFTHWLHIPRPAVPKLRGPTAAASAAVGSGAGAVSSTGTAWRPGHLEDLPVSQQFR